jgi:hypothetical protein
MDARSLHNSAILKLDCCDISNTEPSPVETALAGWIALPADRRGGKPSCPRSRSDVEAAAVKARVDQHSLERARAGLGIVVGRAWLLI